VAFLSAATLSSVMVLSGSALPPNPDPPAPAKEGVATSFEDISTRATRAREAERLDEAARLYRQAVDLRPDWAEGWWFLGTMAYDGDRFEECREAFERLLRIDAQIGPGWALRGLCEFALQDYSNARRHLERAREVGPVANEPLWWVVLYHQALLQLREGEFEKVIPLLRQLTSRPDPGPELLEACGLRLLRRAQLPSEIPTGERELVRAVGRAECASLAGHRSEAEDQFRTLLERYPRQRHLHYGLGLLLAQGGSAKALEAFRHEIELHPDHVLARVELAFNLLRRGRPDEAVKTAEAAVRLDPGVFVTHLALGRSLVAAGDLALGTFELESAARLAPGSAEVFFALGRAYAAGGRDEDAERANARFRELDQARRSGEASP
jgi:tetratricopeptide (TPR) repeat protein